MDLNIIIPTRGRVGRQRTLQFLSPRLRERTIMVAPASEYPRHLGYSYMRGVQFLQQPDPLMSIARKRAWILQLWAGAVENPLRGENTAVSAEKILMLDDDLRFYIRREDVPDRLRYAEAEDQELWFSRLAKMLSPEIPHAGLGPRQGNQNFKEDWQEPGRMMFALGYHVPTVVENCELGRIETREDFDYSLQLLRRGLPNRVCHHFVCGQASYNEAGGASEERTLERSNRDAERLAELHPGYVRVVEKTYKNHPRFEVVVQWRKALSEGQQWRQDTGAAPDGVQAASGGESGEAPPSAPAGSPHGGSRT